ncbi:hypothetical protein G6F43_007388 [Rhizopus delemar]|nr:hypothetical protein G6F43_007388 [Rhizopus delemar]
MMVQLIKEGLLDNHFKCHADGNIRINADKQELLIPEIASSLYQATQDKISFDDSKAINNSNLHDFGLIDYVIRHWTMMPPEPGVHIMTKEQRATMPVDIRNMAEELVPHVRLHLNLTELLRETLNCVEELQKEHRAQLQEAMSDNVQKSNETLLSTIVNPSIIRSNEGNHAKEMKDSPSKLLKQSTTL